MTTNEADFEIQQEQGLYKAERSASLPGPRVFLASNVNNNKVVNACNVVLYVLLFLAVFGLILLVIICGLAWSSRNENQQTTTMKPKRNEKVLATNCHL